MPAGSPPPGGPAARRIGTIWWMDLEQPAPPVKPSAAADYRRLGPEAAGELARAAPGAGDAAQEAAAEEAFRRRFAAGRRCYSAWVAGRLAAYGWVSQGEEYVGELDLRLTLLTCEAYIWDCYTVPDFRRRGLFTALLVYIVSELRQDGFRRAWIGANLENAPSQKGIDRAGFRRIADLGLALEPGRRRFEVIPYPGVPQELMDEAARVYLKRHLDAGSPPEAR